MFKYALEEEEAEKQKQMVRGEGAQPGEKLAEQAKGREPFKGWGDQDQRMLQKWFEKGRGWERSVIFKLFFTLLTLRVEARY